MSSTSLSYRFLKRLGFNYPEDEYGQISFWDILCRVVKTYRDGFLLKFFMDSWLLSPIAPRKLRPAILRTIGCKVGKDVFIGSQVWIDSGHADLITIEEHAHVDARCVLLCHKRELSDYRQGDDYAKLPYKKLPIHIGKGCSVGTGTIVMPGAEIGEGAIIGAGSIVTKPIPAWSIALGQPAKVVKYIEKRHDQ